MSDQPAWVCNDCGRKYGQRIYETHISTWHMDTCGVCGRHAAVTEARDFGYLRDGWQSHQPTNTTSP